VNPLSGAKPPRCPEAIGPEAIGPGQRLAALGVELPGVPVPVGHFRPGRLHGGLLYLSGQGPVMADGSLARGKVGTGVSTADACMHARRTGMVLIAAMREVLGTLDRVAGIVKVLGFVNASPDFTDHARVINGCSDLFREVFAERGEHARSAIGVASLPGNISVEIEAVVAVVEEN